MKRFRSCSNDGQSGRNANIKFTLIGLFLFLVVRLTEGQTDISSVPSSITTSFGGEIVQRVSSSPTDGPTVPAEVVTATDPPVSELPATDAPATDLPATDAPVTDPPTIDPLLVETKAPISPPVLETKPPLPTIPPTKSPTLAPEPVTTLSPTLPQTTQAATTLAPTTSAPTTAAPVAVTDSPTTMLPVPVTPAPTTSAPVATPSPTEATVVETAAPTIQATSAVELTEAPQTTTVPPVDPTQTPTDPPTDPPTVTEVTPDPTEETEDTPVPTEELEPTPKPVPADDTEAPVVDQNTTATEAPLLESTVSGLAMTLSGMGEELDTATRATWKQYTQLHVEEYFAIHSDKGVSKITAEITLTSQEVVNSERRHLRFQNHRERSLQGTSDLIVTYDQKNLYETTASDVTPLSLALDPFSTEQDIENYVQALRVSGDAPFLSLQSVQVREDAGEVTDDASTSDPVPATDTDEDDDEGGNNNNAVIIGVVAGIGGVILLVAVVMFMNKDKGGNDAAISPPNKSAPPTQLNVGGGNDEVSQIPEPNQPKVAPNSNESLGGYGDQSVATVDYDYSKAYGGGGDTSVSSAGGTFGSNTHAQSTGAEPSAPATGPLETSFSESGSQHRGQSQNVKEELIDIYAPPGKLGVVIDTPDDGAPVVHAVKDSSVIADKLQVGDKLVAVDDEDVRSMTAIKVSKLISRKSTNPTRKLSIIRTVVVDE